MADPIFRRVRPPAVDPFRRANRQERSDLGAVQQTYLPWEEVVYRFITNIPRSALEQVKDAAMLVRPVGRAAHGQSTAVLGDYTAFPGLQDLGALVGQAGIAGVEKATGAEIMKEKRVLDGLLEFYKQNYGLGPEGLKGFERFITEDPAGFLTDLMMFASVGSGAVTTPLKTGRRLGAVGQALKQGDAFTDAWKKGQARVSYEQYSPFHAKVNRVLNHGFAVPSALEGLFRRVPIVRKRMKDVPVSFGKRAGETGRGFEMGLTEVLDPAAHVMRGTLGRVARGLGRTLELTAAGEAAERHGVELPLSARTGSKVAATAEASRFKADDPAVVSKEKGVSDALQRIADETVAAISDADEPDIAANLAVEGYERYVAEFKAEMDKLYESIEDLNDLPAVITNSYEFFQEFARDAVEAEPILGRREYSKDLHAAMESILAHGEAYPDSIIRSAPEPPGPTGGTPPDDSSAGVASRRAHRGSKGRMLKGNWGAKYATEYDVVELDDLIQSHTLDGLENPDYNPALQPRDRSDVSSQLQVEDIARNLDPELLLDDTSSMNDGAPIIGDDLMVESGNGRVLALKRAVSEPTYSARYEAYKRKLLSDLDRYGLTADDVGAMRQPVLVRRRVTDVDRVEFVREANDNSGKAFRAAEGAASDARFIDADLMRTFSFGDEANLRDALKAGRNNGFVNGFISKYPAEKQSAFYDATGKKISDEGYARIERAMLLSVFDEDFGVVMANRFADVADEGLINIRKAVYAALPELSHLKYLMEAGERRSDLAFFEDIAQAVLKVRELSETGDTASFARRQGRMFTGAEWGDLYDDLTDDAARILLMVERGKEAPSELTQFLKWYAEQVDAQGSVQQGTLFGDDVPSVTKAEILQTALGDAFEDIPDIAELRRAWRAEQGVEQAPAPDDEWVGKDVVRRARARREGTPEHKEAQAGFLRSHWQGADFDWDQFEESIRSYSDGWKMKQYFGFDTADEVLAHARKMVDDGEWVRPEDIETRIDELRVAIRNKEPVSLKGREVTGPQELAVIAQALRDYSQEWSHVFYVRKILTEEGNLTGYDIVGHETTTLGSGMQTQAPISNEIKAQMAESKADGVFFLHNHPSASAVFSPGDRAAQTNREAIFGEAYLGDLVIDSGTYAYHLQDPLNPTNYFNEEAVQLSAEELGWDPMWDNQFLGRETWDGQIRADDPLYDESGRLGTLWMSGHQFKIAYNSAKDVVAALGGFGRELKIDRNWVSLGMVSSWDRLNAMVQVRGDQLAKLSVQERARFLRELAREYGGEQVHVFVGKGDYYRNRQQAWEMFSQVNDTDVGGGIMSVSVQGQKSGWVNPETDFYKRAWKSGGLERTMVDAVTERRLAMEHITYGEDAYNQIKQSGELRGSPEEMWYGGKHVFFSMGPNWRGRSGSEVSDVEFGFIFSTNDIERLGARVVPEVLIDHPQIQEGIRRFFPNIPESELRRAIDDHELSSRIKDVIMQVAERKPLETMSRFGNEFRLPSPLRFEDAAPVAVVENRQIRVITEETRGADSDKWEYRDPTEEELVDLPDIEEQGLMSYAPEPIKPFSENMPEPPARRGLEETRQGQLPELTWRNVKRTRTIIGDALFARHPDPIVSREKRFYSQLYTALTQDLSEAVAKHAPDRIGEFENISRQYAEGRGKINEGWGLKILRAAQKGEEEKLVRAIFKPDTPVDQIPLIYELFGGKDSEGGRAMQASFVREILKKAKSEDGAWHPRALRRSLNSYGDKRLRAFFDDASVSALNDLADISLGMADFAKMAHGSQTAFLAREMLEGGGIGSAIRKLTFTLGAGPMGILLLMGDIFGAAASQRFFTSPMGERMLMQGGFRSAVGAGLGAATRGAPGHLLRAGNRAIEGEVQ